MDVQMLAKCLDDTPDTSSVPAPSCKFSTLIPNPDNKVKLSIDSVYLPQGYVDVAIHNPDAAVSAFQFSMTGLSVDSARILSLGDSGKVSVFSSPSGLIMGSLLRNQIPKHTQATVFLRVYFDTTTSNQVCISEITAVLSSDLQILGKSAGPCKNIGQVTFVGQKAGRTGLRLIPNPFRQQTRLLFSNPGDVEHSLVVYSSSGKEVFRKTGIKGTEVNISSPNLLPGMYFFQLTGKEVRTGKMWVEN
jgi:hypothetical protein